MRWSAWLPSLILLCVRCGRASVGHDGVSARRHGRADAGLDATPRNVPLADPPDGRTVVEGLPSDATVASDSSLPQNLDFAWHEMRRIDSVAVPPTHWLTRRLPLTRSLDGLDGTIELWGIPATRPVRWNPTDTRHYLFHGWLAGAEGPRGVGILRVLGTDGALLGQLGFEGSLVDLERRPIPSAQHPSWVVDADNAIGAGSWAGVRSFVIAMDARGPRIATATRDADGAAEDMTFLSSLKCGWVVERDGATGVATIVSRCCDHDASATGADVGRWWINGTTYRFDQSLWRSHAQPSVAVEVCPEPMTSLQANR